MNTENYEIEENLLSKILEAIDIFLKIQDYQKAYYLYNIASNLGLWTNELEAKRKLYLETIDKCNSNENLEEFLNGCSISYK